MTRINEPPRQSGNNKRSRCYNENINNTENSSYNDTTNYIIDTNKNLLIENKNLEKEIITLTEKFEELEDDIGRTEKTNTHLKGLLKNFQAISENCEKISKSREIICKSNEEDVLDYVNKIIFIRSLIILFGGGLITYMYLCYTYGYIDLFTSIFTYIITIIQGITISICTNYKLPKQHKIETEIKSYEKDNIKIKETLDFINEYIDSI
jgi:hypothetical protein|tara:strand:- start:787 stop:1413 length:627 start_codon:yes stop_codon:yes gene_type:complete